MKDLFSLSTKKTTIQSMCKKGPKGHYLSAEHFWPGMEERKNFNCLLTNKNQTVKKILKKTLLIWLSKGRSVIWQYSIYGPCFPVRIVTWEHEILTEKNKYSVACFIDVVWSGLDWSDLIGGGGQNHYMHSSILVMI